MRAVQFKDLEIGDEFGYVTEEGSWEEYKKTSMSEAICYWQGKDPKVKKTGYREGFSGKLLVFKFDFI